MSKVLSQDEIDALLSVVGSDTAASRRTQAAAESIVKYNFRRPDRVSKEEIQSVFFPSFFPSCGPGRLVCRGIDLILAEKCR